MLLDVCLGTRTSWKILLVLGESPGKAASRKEIKALTKIGNKALTKFLLLLEKFDIISSSKIGKTYYYKINMSSKFSGQILELIHLEKRELNNPDFASLNILREFAYELTNINLENLHSLILFGSYAKRTYSANSDIDIAVIMKERSTSDELLITDAIDKISKRFKKEIQPHYYTSKEFESRKNDKLVQEIVKDGIRLI